jgi:hypothetical protein
VGRIFSSKNGTTTDTDTVNKLFTKNSTAHIDRMCFRALTFNAKTEIICGGVIGGGYIFERKYAQHFKQNLQIPVPVRHEYHAVQGLVT